MINKSTLLTLLCCVMFISANAQTKISDNIFTKKLPNGLTVIVIEDASTPLASVSMAFKNGACNEVPGFNGQTYMYQTMMYRANQFYGNNDQVNWGASKLGLKRNLSTTEETTESHLTMPAYYIDEGLKYMNAAMRFPVINDQELAAVKDISEKELQGKESNPFFSLNNAMLEHLWGNLAYRKRAIGTHESIAAITVAAIDSLQKRYYYPNNALLTVGGQVSHDKIFAKVEELFGNWQPSKFDPQKKWPAPAFKPLAKTEYYTVENVQATVPMILLAWQGPSVRTDPAATYAADVFSYILGQNSSKLNKALVQSGLALDISFNYLTLDHTGPITLIVRPNPTKVKECVAEVKRQIGLFDSNDYITAEQVATAERKLEITQIRREEVTSDFVTTLTFWWGAATPGYYFNYLPNLQKVKKTDVQNYVRNYIKNKPYCAGLLISPTMRTALNTNEFFKAQ